MGTAAILKASLEFHSLPLAAPRRNACDPKVPRTSVLLNTTARVLLARDRAQRFNAVKSSVAIVKHPPSVCKNALCYAKLLQAWPIRGCYAPKLSSSSVACYPLAAMANTRQNCHFWILPFEVRLTIYDLVYGYGKIIEPVKISKGLMALEFGHRGQSRAAVVHPIKDVVSCLLYSNLQRY